MRALLLSAGIGSRLRPLTDRTPKCLVPILGRPLIDYWLDWTLGQGMEKVLINTHHISEQVNDHIAASPWRDRITLLHEDTLLGTGGTILRNREFFAEEPFFVAHADNLTLFDLLRFQERHAAAPDSISITMMTFQTDTPESCGIVEEDDRGIVRAFHEKVAHPPSNMANGAVYIFNPTIFDFLKETGKEVIDLSTEVIPHFVGRIQTFENSVYHRDIGTAASLQLAEMEFGGKLDEWNGRHDGRR